MLLSKCESCPVAQVPGVDVRASSGKRVRKLKASACQLPDAKLPPAWTGEDALHLFGYECDDRGILPDDGNVLVMETWSRNGNRTTRRLPLPKASSTVERLLATPSGVVAWFAAANGSAGSLLRFVDGTWKPLGEVPPGFVPNLCP
ncbi:MAG: hypothetical protein QM784_17550 [Polyangiaceae bacterium]